MGILNRLVRRVYAAAFAMPPRVGMYVRNRTMPWGRPSLAYHELLFVYAVVRYLRRRLSGLCAAKFKSC